jgi:hypothetical protein
MYFVLIEFMVLHYSYFWSHFNGTFVWDGFADQKVDIETLCNWVAFLWTPDLEPTMLILSDWKCKMLEMVP